MGEPGQNVKAQNAMGAKRKEKLILIREIHKGAEAGKPDWGVEGTALIGLEHQVRMGQTAQDRKTGACGRHLEHQLRSLDLC